MEEDLVQTGPEWLLMILDRYGMQICANFLMLIWSCGNVRNNVVMAGENISIGGSVKFLSRYMEAPLMIRQQDLAVDEKGK